MDLIFSTPWWLPTGLLAVGAALFWSGNKRIDQGMKRLGFGLILAAVLVMIVSSIVETPKEKAIRITKAVINAYKDHDWDKMQSLLDPATKLANYGNRNMIMAGAKASIDKPGVKDVHVLSIEADQEQTHIGVTTTVVAAIDQAQGRPVTSTWRFDYVNFGGEWTLESITPLRLMGESPDAIVRELPRVAQ